MLGHTIESLLSKGIIKPSGCIEWPHTSEKHPYGSVRHMGRKMQVHRLMYQLKHPEECLEGKVIRHQCDNPACFNPSHLISGTQADNVRDMKERGRGGNHKGINHGRSKLTEEQVHAIKFSTTHLNNKECASLFGVNHRTVSAIRRGIIWTHVAE